MATIVRTSSFLLLALFCMFHYSASSHEKKQQQQLSSAIVVGTVSCDSSSSGRDLSKPSHFISGASVAVECGDGATRPSFRKEVKTNQRGVFRARLPAGVDGLKGCSVRLIRSSEPFCSVASSAASAELRLVSRRNGLRVFSAGRRLTFKPPAPDANSASPAEERKQARPAFLLPPPIPFLPSPPIPFLPSPPIPFLPSPPNVGGVPLPPIPLVPPPSLLPPIVPSPPPSLLPPVLPTPPPAPLIGIPPFPLPIPPLPSPPIPFPLPTPTSPPPPASIFPPLPPNPLFPGIPPASPPAAKTSP